MQVLSFSEATQRSVGAMPSAFRVIATLKRGLRRWREGRESMSDPDRMRLRTARFLLSEHMQLAPPWPSTLIQLVRACDEPEKSSHDIP